MVVHQDDGCGRVLDGGTEHFAGVHQRSVEDPARHEDVLEDGVFAQGRIQHRNGSYTLLGLQSLNGRFRGRLLTRDIAGQGRLSLDFHDQSSAPVPFDIINEISLFEPTIELISQQNSESLKLKVGPFATTSGYTLNDGTSVKITIAPRQGEALVVHGWIKAGRFEKLIPLDADSGPFAILVESPLGLFTSHGHAKNGS